tara:strand:- start:5632 stop:5844 length:213 start_codon:yes stop_codon:yes gene_type:complete
MANRKKKIKGCTGKIKYESQLHAKNAMHGMLRRQKKKGFPRAANFNVYGCRCGSFHVGKTRSINWASVKI